MEFTFNENEKNSNRDPPENWDPKKLRQLVLMDDLTGLFNRRYFRLRLDEEEKRCRKHGKIFSLMMLDVNRFKEINDVHGHLMGDQVLVYIGKVLRESVREEDIVCRWAGDEFVVILPESGDEETKNVANRIMNAVKDFQWGEKLGIEISGVSLSLGYAIFPDDAMDLLSLIEKADRALYGAKKKGKPLRVVEVEPQVETRKKDVKGPAVFGKQQELKVLTKALEMINRDAPQFFLLRGEMGVGKTFTVERIEEEARKLKILVLRGRCDEEAGDKPLFPFKDLFNHFIAQDREKDYFSSVKLPESSITELSRLSPIWAKHKSIDRATQNEMGRDRFLLFEAFSQFLTKLSETTGVLLIIEDIHWADLASLALFQFLVRTLEHGRIVLFLTARPLDTTLEGGRDTAALRELLSMEKGGRFQHLVLNPLSKNDSLMMIRDLLGESKPGAEAVEEFYRITEGNPFFIKGMAEFAGKADRFPQEFDDLPPTIHEAISQKIEKLSTEARTAFQVASILGREFEFDVLLNILHINEGYLLDIIDEGIRFHIIEEVQDFNGDRYSFVQNIIWKVLNSMIPESDLSDFHRRAGHAIEQYDLEGIEDRFGELAHHFELGGDQERALGYSLKAARKARELYAHDEAISFYKKAAKLARSMRNHSDGDKLLQIYEERGLVYMQVGDYRRSQRDFEKVLELSTGTGNRGKIGHALKHLSNISIFKREFEKAYEYSLRTMQHATEEKDTGLKAESLAAFGNIHLFSGEYEKALACYNKALNLDKKSHDSLRVSKLYTNLGVIYWYKEQYTKALDHYQKANEVLARIGNKTLQPLCVNNIAMITLQRGQFSEALKMCEEALQIARETGNRIIQAYSYNNIGEIYQRIGDYETALDWGRKAVSLIKQVKDKGSRADFLRNRGVDYYYLGEKKKALLDLNKALLLSRSTGKKEYEMNDLYWLIRLLVDEDRLDEAKHHLQAFSEIIASRKSREYSTRYAIASSLIHCAEGELKKALLDIETVEFDGEELDPYLEIKYDYQRAVILDRMGQKKKSRDSLQKAWREAQSLSRNVSDRKLKKCFLGSRFVVSVRDLLRTISSTPPD